MSTAFSLLLIVLALPPTLRAEDAAPKTPQALSDLDAKPFTEKFWKEYSRKEVRKQICLAFGMLEEAENDEADIAVSMSGPHFVRNHETKNVEGFLRIGFVGCFVVKFEEGKLPNSEFMETLSGEGKRYQTFQECYDLITKLFPKLFPKQPQPDPNGDRIKPEPDEAPSSPATKPGNDKVAQPESQNCPQPLPSPTNPL
jgi:hypothetical protein